MFAYGTKLASYTSGSMSLRVAGDRIASWEARVVTAFVIMRDINIYINGVSCSDRYRGEERGIGFGGKGQPLFALRMCTSYFHTSTKRTKFGLLPQMR
jgi:hypothetical protein